MPVEAAIDEQNGTEPQRTDRVAGAGLQVCEAVPSAATVAQMGYLDTKLDWITDPACNLSADRMSAYPGRDPHPAKNADLSQRER